MHSQANIKSPRDHEPQPTYTAAESTSLWNAVEHPDGHIKQESSLVDSMGPVDYNIHLPATHEDHAPVGNVAEALADAGTSEDWLPALYTDNQDPFTEGLFTEELEVPDDLGYNGPSVAFAYTESLTQSPGAQAGPGVAREGVPPLEEMQAEPEQQRQGHTLKQLEATIEPEQLEIPRHSFPNPTGAEDSVPLSGATSSGATFVESFTESKTWNNDKLYESQGDLKSQVSRGTGFTLRVTELSIHPSASDQSGDSSAQKALLAALVADILPK